MHVRPLNLFDLPAMGRYRRDLLALDSARALTQGNLLAVSSLLPFLHPWQHIYTAIQEDDLTSAAGQIVLEGNDAFARISFLTPGAAGGEDEAALLDHLVQKAGEWGALYVVAEVEESNSAYKTLRMGGFAMYAWQKVWRLGEPAGGSPAGQWRPPSAGEMLAVQSLYSQIVPALLQPVDPMPRKPAGLACTSDGKIQVYAAMTSGPAGIWLRPLVHPDSAHAAGCLEGLLQAIPNRGGRPVYLCMRSYQAWLESALEELGAEAGPKQAVMVKHLAAMIRDEVKVNVPEKAFVKPAAPVSRSSTDK